MRSKKELEQTTSTELLEWIFKELKSFKAGQKCSTETLLNSYFYGNNYYKINPYEFDKLLISSSRDYFYLFDFSKLYGEKKRIPYKQEFVVWRKKNYISEDEFRDLCDEYDSLFVDLELNDAKFETKKKKILAEWKKDCAIFKKNPNFQRKRKKIIRVKDLDRTPFDPPVKEELPCKDIHIIPIGSGSDGNCMYIEMGDHKFLVDAGISCKKTSNALTKNGRTIDDVEALFVTHGHSDHISSIKSVAAKAACPIYTSEYVQRDLEELGLDSTIIEPYQRVEPVPGLFVTMFEARHDYIMTYGFVFETENSKVSYLTDNGKMNEEQLRQMCGSDVAVLEANFDLDMLEEHGSNMLTWRISMNHSSNIRCGYTIISLHDSGTRNFILAHVSKGNNKYDLILDTIRTMLRSRYANIYICKPESDEMLMY